MALETELATYERKRQELLANEGRYVLIKGDSVAGIWDTYEDVIEAGYDKFGLSGFFVRKIAAVDPILEITRFFTCS